MQRVLEGTVWRRTLLIFLLGGAKYADLKGVMAGANEALTDDLVEMSSVNVQPVAP